MLLVETRIRVVQIKSATCKLYSAWKLYVIYINFTQPVTIVYYLSGTQTTPDGNKFLFEFAKNTGESTAIYG